MKTQYSTREALAAAIYAFKANGDTVVKDIYGSSHEDKFPNKSYLLKHFVDTNMCAELSDFEITKELLVEADTVKQQLEYIITMSALTQGRLNSFITNCAELITQDTVTAKSFGTLVWVPKIVFDNERQTAAKLTIASMEYSSKYIGKVNELVELHFNLIEKRYIGRINCWAAYGNTNEGNLVRFLTKHEALCVTGQIKGRIKATDKDSYHGNAQVTSLNHVKKL
jgi:hypothetical protein